jgi:hypothetical protein
VARIFIVKKKIMENEGIGFLPTILGISFIILKLCNVIGWSWWWVLAPFWGAILIKSIYQTFNNK